MTKIKVLFDITFLDRKNQWEDMFKTLTNYKIIHYYKDMNISTWILI